MSRGCCERLGLISPRGSRLSRWHATTAQAARRDRCRRDRSDPADGRRRSLRRYPAHEADLATPWRLPAPRTCSQSPSPRDEDHRWIPADRLSFPTCGNVEEAPCKRTGEAANRRSASARIPAQPALRHCELDPFPVGTQLELPAGAAAQAGTAPTRSDIRHAEMVAVGTYAPAGEMSVSSHRRSPLKPERQRPTVTATALSWAGPRFGRRRRAYG
jgi:hypothetical protein